MKLLLTSGGITNKSIASALLGLLGKPFDKASLVFIPTAANYERGDKGWMIDDMINLKKLKFEFIDIIDISALPKEKWEKEIRQTDLICVGGGNTYYLAYWMEKSGLKEMLPKMLENTVYMGISAGSCVTNPLVETPLDTFFPEEVNEYNTKQGLDLVPFYILPHLYSKYFKKLRNETTVQEVADKFKQPLFALDDQSAIKVVDGKVEMISEGKYLKFNQ